ncbi:MAG: hypothetical protein DHS20C18_05860 [Saprospiraceae bacterium]|nr:MAG: hypothetical protein DHS20C18_05860 [Saprospiraceae bacterium]
MALGAGLQTQAQIQAPDLICVANDTLTWTIPANNCGPFQAYTIYASQDISGPYTVLASITNSGQTTYVHENSSTMVWYYYMESDYNCSGQSVEQSDTLDNRIPAPSPIDFVTVNGNSVRIQWSLSPSPEVFAYLIARNTNLGTTVIDTIFVGNTYQDFTADPGVRPETYFVTAIDRCGNASLVVDPHNTIFLETENQDPCMQSINLSWNEYINWPAGVARYAIWVSTNGSSFEEVSETPATQTQFSFQDVDDNTTYCFYVEAERASSSFISRSTEICVTTSVVQPVRDLALVNAGLTGDGAIGVDWTWNTNAELAQASISRSVGASGMTAIPVTLSNPLILNNFFLDEFPEFNLAPVHYVIETVDDCGENRSSNEVVTVFLQGSNTTNGINNLSWTPYQNSLADKITYDVYRIETGGIPEKLNDQPFAELSAIDEVNLANPSELESCYYVVANATLSLPDGRMLDIQSRSNTVCLQQTAQLWVPNAFVPDGFNREFKPVLQFGTPEDYLMIIYDRWGGKIFESNSFSLGWNGQKDDRPLPQGVYLFQIILTQANGTRLEEKGSVLLLR